MIVHLVDGCVKDFASRHGESVLRRTRGWIR